MSTPVEGVKHRFLFRRGPHENEGGAGQRQQGRRPPHQGHSHPSRSNQRRRPSAGSCSAGGSLRFGLRQDQDGEGVVGADCGRKAQGLLAAAGDRLSLHRLGLDVLLVQDLHRDVTITIVHPEHVKAETVERGPLIRTRADTLALASGVGADDPFAVLVVPEPEPEDPPAEQTPAGGLRDWFERLGWEWPW